MSSEPDDFPESNSFINYEATVQLNTDYHILTISSSSVLTFVLKKLTLLVDDPKKINIELNIFIQNTKKYWIASILHVLAIILDVRLRRFCTLSSLFFNLQIFS